MSRRDRPLRAGDLALLVDEGDDCVIVQTKGRWFGLPVKNCWACNEFFVSSRLHRLRRYIRSDGDADE